MENIVFNSLCKAFEPNNDIMELMAIGLTKKIKVSNQGVVNTALRITDGDLIEVIDDKLTGGDNFNYKIIGCYGNIANSLLYIIVQSISKISDMKILNLKN